MDGLYFNEFEPFAAEWLGNLWPNATIDTRDIREVQPGDVARFRRCHFFGGIGGWEYALELAGWGDMAVWTVSCPCHPFIDAGARKAEADERHVWPELFRLITECQPAIVFGEQVASQLGREWLAGIRNDLETVGYEVGAADLCAASVGAPHKRQRLYWVAYAGRERIRGVGLRKDAGATGGTEAEEPQRQRIWTDAGNACSAGVQSVANSVSERCGETRGDCRRPAQRIGDGGQSTQGVGDASSPRPQEQWRE